MRYWPVIVIGLILLTSPAVNAQSVEFRVGGGSSRCIVRIGSEGPTIIPIGRTESFFSSTDEVQSRQLLNLIQACVGLAIVCLLLLLLLFFTLWTLLSWGWNQVADAISSA